MSSNGRTTGFEPVYLGSTPSVPTMRFLILALLLTACATGTPPRPIRATDANVKTVARVSEFVSPSAWRSSGYARLGEVETPFKLVLAADGTVCPVMTLDVEPIRVGEYYACKNTWRMRQ